MKRPTFSQPTLDLIAWTGLALVCSLLLVAAVYVAQGCRAAKRWERRVERVEDTIEAVEDTADAAERIKDKVTPKKPETK